MQRRKKKNRTLMIAFLFMLLITAALFIYIYFFEKTDINKTKDINFSEKVITIDEIKIYSSDNNSYIESGLIGKDVELSLENIDNEYFKIKDFDNCYIKYENVNGISDRTAYNDRYKEYILFNYNVETEGITVFYDESNNMVYTFNEGYSLPLIIKDEDKYGVEFNNRLLYIKKEDSELVEHHNTDLHNSSGVGVLNYHFFYDGTKKEDNASCSNQVICISDIQFREELDYLKENHILTIKMKELEMYVDGKINLPRSVLITIDDGWNNEIAVDLLTEYKMYGTIFLVTSWFDEGTYYKTDYIELHSHTHNMHDVGECPGGQGGAIKCWPKDKIQEDLKQSREELNGTTYIAYPFYEYNSYAIENLKEAGFTMAFIGDTVNGDDLVHVGSNKFKLYRFVIVNYTTINDLKKYFGQIK